MRHHAVQSTETSLLLLTSQLSNLFSTQILFISTAWKSLSRFSSLHQVCSKTIRTSIWYNRRLVFRLLVLFMHRLAPWVWALLSQDLHIRCSLKRRIKTYLKISNRSHWTFLYELNAIFIKIIALKMCSKSSITWISKFFLAEFRLLYLRVMCSIVNRKITG